MTTKEVKKLIKGKDWDVFLDWMIGQTCSCYPDGTTNWYEHDVNRFIRYKCDPNNEPFAEWD